MYLLLYIALIIGLSSLIYGYDSIYELAMAFHHNDTSSNSTNRQYKRVHIIRVPKASSSSLSMVARRLVGCEPPGPCCRWPGDPPGSCPAKGLYECEMQKKVIGCTHHHPNYHALLDPYIISLTFMRDPVNRALSAYGYGNIHYNSKCGKKEDPVCISAYINNHAFQNIAVKLFTGQYAYSDRITCRNISFCENSLELALVNMKHFKLIGVTELWQLSLLLLHRRVPSLLPVSYEFYIHDTVSENSHGVTGLRVRSHSADTHALFETFKPLLTENNELDIMLYNAVVDKFCLELYSFGLWDYEIVRAHWRHHSRVNTSQCH